MALSSWQVNLLPGTGCFDIFQLNRLHWPGRDAFWEWMRGCYMRLFASSQSITCSECCQWLPTACRIQFLIPHIAGINSFLLPCVFHVRPPSFNPDTLCYFDSPGSSRAHAPGIFQDVILCFFFSNLYFNHFWGPMPCLPLPRVPPAILWIQPAPIHQHFTHSLSWNVSIFYRYG